ncbi:MAG: hypothetical protein OXE76_04390 [Alphaproteobacteria bacterium]|nr:hypothetical protein [Alphaproteobacteria bacterium]
MKALNIFEVIRKTTSRIEPFHSEFLGEALRVSASGDRSLFDAVWRLAAPAGWDIPHSPRIETEEKAEEDRKDRTGGRRIDISIHDDKRGRLLGIEVKTTKASAKEGQLESYLDGLAKKCGYDKKDEDRIAITYLTPFNRGRAGEHAKSLPTVEIFDQFQQVHGNARHISWLDIADIAWDGNELWRQHRAYVHQEISNYEQLEKIMSRDRSFDIFFSEDAIEKFWSEFPYDGKKDAKTGLIVDLKEHKDDVSRLVRAFEFLINDTEYVAAGANKQNDVSETLMAPFLGSAYAPIHRAIFDLARRYAHVWLAGKEDYGLRVAHKDHSSGVSLVRSKGERYLQIGQSR